MSTGHANSCRDMLSRLETMVLSAAPLPIEVIRKQIASALDIVVHLSRLRDGSRRVMEIQEVSGIADGDIECNPLFTFVEEGELHGAVIGRLVAAGNPLLFPEKLFKAGLSRQIRSVRLIREEAS